MLGANARLISRFWKSVVCDKFAENRTFLMKAAPARLGSMVFVEILKWAVLKFEYPFQIMSEILVW